MSGCPCHLIFQSTCLYFLPRQYTVISLAVKLQGQLGFFIVPTLLISSRGSCYFFPLHASWLFFSFEHYNLLPLVSFSAVNPSPSSDISVPKILLSSCYFSVQGLRITSHC
ncbi:unnamed protein product [Pipistrellus nathusii]|uniref:Uncharacterized protein n=1 Tax=Pipistrellus nathusii TaxID=59473 RepID=A0ABP0AA89_PIPNA